MPACPLCGAQPGDRCVIPDSDPPVKREDPHAHRCRVAHPRPADAQIEGSN